TTIDPSADTALAQDSTPPGGNPSPVRPVAAVHRNAMVRSGLYQAVPTTAEPSAESADAVLPRRSELAMWPRPRKLAGWAPTDGASKIAPMRDNLIWFG